MYERHKKFVGWVRNSNFSEFHRGYCEYIKTIGYKDVRSLHSINIQLSKFLNHMYNYLGHYDDTAYLKVRHLHSKISNLISKIEASNNEAYDWREDKHERYYEDDGP